MIFTLLNLFFAFLSFYLLLECEMDKVEAAINGASLVMNIFVVISHLK